MTYKLFSRFRLCLIRRVTVAASFVACLGLVADPALAEGRKLALVVGNAAYEHVPALATPAVDAQAIAARLRGLGFEVTVQTDVAPAVFDAVLAAFADQTTGAEAVVFYYSGHAFQKDGVNHLVPVTARLDDPARLSAETWSLTAIVSLLKQNSDQVLVFLDASRGSPVAPVVSAAAGVGSGLALFDGGPGTFLSSAAAPGAVVADRGGVNSPYTAALLGQLELPGQSLSDMMIGLRNAVLDATGGTQSPWDQSSLRSQFYFQRGGPAPQSAEGEDSLLAFDVVDAGSEVVGEVRLRASASAANAAVGLDNTAPAVQSPAPVPATQPVAVPSQQDLPRAVQQELTRIGCYDKGIDGDWGNGSRNAMRHYYRSRGLSEGPVEPTASVFLTLVDEPVGTCATPAPGEARPAAAAKTPAKKKKPETVRKSAPAQKAAPKVKKPKAEPMIKNDFY